MSSPADSDSNDFADGVPGDTEQSFLSHLVELRQRVMWAVLAVLIITLCLLPFSRDIYNFLAAPLLDELPEGVTMVAVEVASPFLTPFKMTLLTGVFLAMPVIIFQIWSFVAPGLYNHEKRIAVPILVSSCALFYLGCAFAYFVVFPLVFAFFNAVTPEGVTFMPDIAHYLNFLLLIFFAFGLAFEVPIVVFILLALGVTTAESLHEKRPYIIVGAFVVGMLLTPPDIISQTLLALPMWVLYELGIIFSKILLNRMPARDDEAEGEA
ncbi:MAG: twin-arginine translocase subunit TatC [Pseudomonadota bacterium]